MCPGTQGAKLPNYGSRHLRRACKLFLAPGHKNLSHKVSASQGDAQGISAPSGACRAQAPCLCHAQDGGVLCGQELRSSTAWLLTGEKEGEGAFVLRPNSWTWEMSAYVDGPYGAPVPVEDFSCCLKASYITKFPCCEHSFQ